MPPSGEPMRATKPNLAFFSQINAGEGSPPEQAIPDSPSGK